MVGEIDDIVRVLVVVLKSNPAGWVRVFVDIFPVFLPYLIGGMLPIKPVYMSTRVNTTPLMMILLRHFFLAIPNFLVRNSLVYMTMALGDATFRISVIFVM